tara:strand:+ start:18929 stop:19195 length:267 start_codon:yes stop_codon:yes gene_type:complete
MIQPIRNQILVKPFQADYESAGGIVVPDSFKEESNKVEIIEVGKGLKNKPMLLKKGDIGFRVKDWGTPIEDNGVLYYLMEQDSIIALA